MKISCFIKCFGLILSSLLSYQMKAQKLHLPDEDEAELLKEKISFCKPGVVNQSRGRGILLQYGGVSGFDVTPEGGLSDAQNTSSVSHVDQVKAKIKIPLANTPTFKMLAGYEYNAETFHFNKIGELNRDVFQSLDGNPLRNNKFSLYLTKAFDNKYYAGLRVRSSYRGDYDKGLSFDSRYATYSALAVFGVKPRPDLEWGIGLTYSDNFFRTQVLPFAIYNRTFNDKWGLEMVIPVQLMGRYNFREDRILLFGAEYQSDSYALDVLDSQSGNTLPYYFRHSEVAIKASYDHHVASWIWMTAEGGLQLPVRNRFDAVDMGASFNNQAGAQPFFKIGIFATPPRNCIK